MHTALVQSAITTNFDWNALTNIHFSFDPPIHADNAAQHLKELNAAFAQQLVDFLVAFNGIFITDADVIKILRPDPLPSSDPPSLM
eukprot:jgi/Psemu1/2352/gm1.2352_g